VASLAHALHIRPWLSVHRLGQVVQALCDGEAGPIRVPVTFAWGNRDRFVSRTAAESCGRYVTGAYRFTELDDASHWLPELAPGRVAELLAEHFAATP
jgi:pimeloyl-ACP methyl ester carboxylesterase